MKQREMYFAYQEIIIYKYIVKLLEKIAPLVKTAEEWQRWRPLDQIFLLTLSAVVIRQLNVTCSMKMQ
jgi:hypothetical protein